jgi:hypothetical protein
MTLNTADYALIVSLCSAAISLAGFVWNVWSKFIFPKGDIKVSYYVAVMVTPGEPVENRPTFLCLSIANHGPTDVTIRNAVGVFRKGRFGHQTGLLPPLENIFGAARANGVFGAGLPKPLKVGEEYSLYFAYEAQSFGRDKMLKVGAFDNFNRKHWARKRDIRKVKASLEKDFGAIAYVPPEAGRED